MDTSLTSPWVSFDTTVPEFPDVAEEILESLDIEAKNITYVSSVEFGIDRFSYSHKNKRFILSYTFNEDERLSLEHKFLESNKKPQTLEFVCGGISDFCGEKVHYIITSYDCAEPLSENLAFLALRFNHFWETHSELCSQNIKCRSIKDLVSSLGEGCSLAHQFTCPPKFNWLFVVARNLLNGLGKTPKYLSSKDKVCHGNLTVDSVIVAGDLCKIIDWKYCVNADPVFDVFYLAISRGLNFEESLALYEKIGRNASEKKLEPIYWFVFRVFMLKNLIDYCWWAFSKQRSDGSVLFSTADKLKKALNIIEDTDNVLSEKEIQKLKNLFDGIFFEEKLNQA